jgi:hypothetical protein
VKQLPPHFVLAAFFLAGCASGPTDFSKEYQLAAAARPGVVLGDNAAGERAAQRFAGLYSDLSEQNVAAKVREVYAPDAWFNDTVATEVGVEAIERYLLKTARGAELVQAKVKDVAVSGSDCYVRWTMEVRTKSLAGGRPILTEGMSQLRFDPQGRITLHQDFWNPAAGIYQHLPLLGPAIRYVNHLIAKPE